MKVVCYDLALNDTYIDHLTIGKTYEVLYIHEGYWRDNLYTITNDVGSISRYNYRLFISIEVWREKQLDLIGI